VLFRSLGVFLTSYLDTQAQALNPGRYYEGLWVEKIAS
jgi:hypothetical protein